MPLNLDAVCHSEGAFFKGYVQDISTGGLKLETQKRLEKGEKVDLTIDSIRPLKIAGIIRWRVAEKLHFLYGIQFEELSEEREAELRELVQDLFWKSFGG